MTRLSASIKMDRMNGIEQTIIPNQPITFEDVRSSWRADVFVLKYEFVFLLSTVMAVMTSLKSTLLGDWHWQQFISSKVAVWRSWDVTGGSVVVIRARVVSKSVLRLVCLKPTKIPIFFNINDSRAQTLYLYASNHVYQYIY